MLGALAVAWLSVATVSPQWLVYVGEATYTNTTWLTNWLLVCSCSGLEMYAYLCQPHLALTDAPFCSAVALCGTLQCCQQRVAGHLAPNTWLIESMESCTAVVAVAHRTLLRRKLPGALARSRQGQMMVQLSHSPNRAHRTSRWVLGQAEVACLAQCLLDDEQQLCCSIGCCLCLMISTFLTELSGGAVMAPGFPLHNERAGIMNLMMM